MLDKLSVAFLIRLSISVLYHCRKWTMRNKQNKTTTLILLRALEIDINNFMQLVMYCFVS